MSPLRVCPRCCPPWFPRLLTQLTNFCTVTHCFIHDRLMPNREPAVPVAHSLVSPTLSYIMYALYRFVRSDKAVIPTGFAFRLYTESQLRAAPEFQVSKTKFSKMCLQFEFSKTYLILSNKLKYQPITPLRSFLSCFEYRSSPFVCK